MLVVIVPCPWPWLPMMVVVTAAQKPCARDVHSEAEAGDRDGFGEMDRHRGKQTADRLVADQQRDHREDDGARETGEIAQLAGAEGETRIIGMPPRVAIGKGGKQQRARMGAHMHPVGDESD